MALPFDILTRIVVDKVREKLQTNNRISSSETEVSEQSLVELTNLVQEKFELKLKESLTETLSDETKLQQLISEKETELTSVILSEFDDIKDEIKESLFN